VRYRRRDGTAYMVLSRARQVNGNPVRTKSARPERRGLDAFRFTRFACQELAGVSHSARRSSPVGDRPVRGPRADPLVSAHQSCMRGPCKCADELAKSPRRMSRLGLVRVLALTARTSAELIDAGRGQPDVGARILRKTNNRVPFAYDWQPRLMASPRPRRSSHTRRHQTDDSDG
jgi:hypothetical protein